MPRPMHRKTETDGSYTIVSTQTEKQALAGAATVCNLLGDWGLVGAHKLATELRTILGGLKRGALFDDPADDGVEPASTEESGDGSA